jgi:hypothetical protein
MNRYSRLDPIWKKALAALASPSSVTAAPWDSGEPYIEEKLITYKFKLTPEELATVKENLGGEDKQFWTHDKARSGTARVRDTDLWVDILGGKQQMKESDAMALAVQVAEDLGVSSPHGEPTGEPLIPTPQEGWPAPEKLEESSLRTADQEQSVHLMLDYSIWNVDVEVFYDISPAEKGRGPSMDNAGGNPDVPGSIDFNRVEVKSAVGEDGQPAPSSIMSDLGDEILEQLRAHKDPYEWVAMSISDSMEDGNRIDEDMMPGGKEHGL